VSNDRFSRLFNLSINENVSVKDVVSSGLEDGGQSWRRIMFAWDEELVEECKALLANFPLQDLEEDV